MPRPKLRLPQGVPGPIADGFARLLAETKIATRFPDDVLADAGRCAEHPKLPDRDLTNLRFQTLDPQGSMDLDQAFFLARRGSGYTVWYAIADVAGFVHPDSAVDAESRRRGQTMYSPTARFPLHPPRLSEDAASLLADGHARPAAVWRIDLDSFGEVTASDVGRAMVKNTAQLSYEDTQNRLDAGETDESLLLLREIGILRQKVEEERGGISLNLPEQEISVDGGQWVLGFRQLLPVEGWNAQISLLTGAAAAKMMLEGGIGVLRTLPQAEAEDLARLRRTAQGLGIAWPDDWRYPQFVRSLDPSTPSHLAMMTACTRLFRGAGYLSFTSRPAGETKHAALAMDYAHVTAPLRRLVDRFGTEICLAQCAGTSVPSWVTGSLATLPSIMGQSDQRASAFENGVISLSEALILSSLVGSHLTATVVSTSKQGGRVQISDPAVQIDVEGDHLPLGCQIEVSIVSTDISSGKVTARAL